MTEKFKINKWLYPLTWLYALIASIRNKLFDRGALREMSFPVPVISIGNLTIGGTGKTPHTEYLINILNKKYRVAVLSRGYRRKTTGFVLANENSSCSTIGDEPLQMYRKYASVVVAVDANRRRGIRRLLQLPDNQRPELILLDDAFQHRYIKPSLSILLTDIHRPFYDDCPLPAGRLREPPKNYRRADRIIVTKCPEAITTADCMKIREKIGLLPHQQLFFSAYSYKNLQPVFPAVAPRSMRDIPNCSVLLIAGLANPSGLIEYIGKYSPNLQTAIFPDHHDFTWKDIRIIADFLEKNPDKDKIIITSEKDAMRLVNNPFIGEKMKSFLFYIPIEVVILFDEELFTQNIENHVTTFKRNSIMA